MATTSWEPSTTVVADATLPQGQNTGLVRLVTDYNVDVALGRMDSREVLIVSGRNPDVGAGSTEAIWVAGGAYTGFLTTAAALRVKSGGNAADDAAGLGARTITVVALRDDMSAEAVIVTLAGASASAPTANTYRRILSATVATTGAYGVANTGDIDIETTGGALVARIPAGVGKTERAIFTVPNDRRAVLRRVRVVVASVKPTTIRLYRRANPDVTSAPFSPAIRFLEMPEIEGTSEIDFTAMLAFGPKEDIWAEATGGPSGAAVTVDFELELVRLPQ